MNDFEQFSQRLYWTTEQIPEAVSFLYVKELLLNPLFFNISFQLKKKEAATDAFFILNLITSVLGTAIANLDDAPVSLSGVKLDNMYDSTDQIASKIINKYKDDAAKILLKLVGSINIIGNPVGLFGNISDGVTDLFEKPMQGFL